MGNVINLNGIRQNRRNRRSKHTVTALSIGERIRLARVDRCLSQDDLGRKIGYSQPEVSRIENDEVRVTHDIMAAIFEALGSNELVEWYLAEMDPVMALWREWNRKPAA